MAQPDLTPALVLATRDSPRIVAEDLAKASATAQGFEFLSSPMSRVGSRSLWVRWLRLVTATMSADRARATSDVPPFDMVAPA